MKVGQDQAEPVKTHFSRMKEEYLPELLLRHVETEKQRLLCCNRSLGYGDPECEARYMAAHLLSADITYARDTTDNAIDYLDAVEARFHSTAFFWQQQDNDFKGSGLATINELTEYLQQVRQEWEKNRHD